MKLIEILLEKYKPVEPSPELLTKGVELIGRQHREAGDARVNRQWRLASGILTALLLGSLALNVTLWFDDDLARGRSYDPERTLYVRSNVLRNEQGRFIREVRYEYAQDAGESK